MIDNHFLSALIEQVKYIGAEVIQKRNQPDFKVQVKEDQSVVTSSDFWANDIITTFIASYFTDHVIIGEESSQKSYKSGSPYVWYVDPIDGTQSYVKGENHFFILVGLAIHGIPAFGLMYKPVDDILIHTTPDNTVAFFDKGHKKSFPSLNWKPNGSLVFKKASWEQKKEVEELVNQSREPYIYDMVSTLGPIFEKSNGYIGFRRTYFWDLCAPAAIMLKLGYQLKYFNFDGNEMLMNSGIVKCRAYYSLPHDAPEILINWFHQQIPKILLDVNDSAD